MILKLVTSVSLDNKALNNMPYKFGKKGLVILKE